MYSVHPHHHFLPVRDAHYGDISRSLIVELPQSWPTWLIDHDMQRVMIPSHDLEEGVCWRMEGGGDVENLSTTAMDCSSLCAIHAMIASTSFLSDCC